MTDFPAYPQWNPFIVSVEGIAEAGTRLTITLQMADGRRHKFQPTLLQATPPVRLRWLGRLGLPGVFDGEHSFLLEAVAGGTRLRHEEYFEGFLVPLLWRQLQPDALQGFEAMNQALKQRAESGA